MCESGLEISCYYEPHKEFLWARTKDETSELMERAAKDSAMVEEIGHRAWKHTQAKHLYSHRASQLIKWIEEL